MEGFGPSGGPYRRSDDRHPSFEFVECSNGDADRKGARCPADGDDRLLVLRLPPQGCRSVREHVKNIRNCPRLPRNQFGPVERVGPRGCRHLTDPSDLSIGECDHRDGHDVVFDRSEPRRSRSPLSDGIRKSAATSNSACTQPDRQTTQDPGTVDGDHEPTVGKQPGVAHRDVTSVGGLDLDPHGLVDRRRSTRGSAARSGISVRKTGSPDSAMADWSAVRSTSYRPERRRRTNSRTTPGWSTGVPVAVRSMVRTSSLQHGRRVVDQPHELWVRFRIAGSKLPGQHPRLQRAALLDAEVDERRLRRARAAGVSIPLPASYAPMRSPAFWSCDIHVCRNPLASS